MSCAMLGLLAVYLFYRAAQLYMGRADRRVLYVLAFVPSSLFWSSILGKDPIVLLGVALYTYGFVAWYRARRLRYVAVLLFGVLLAAAMRLWAPPPPLATHGGGAVRESPVHEKRGRLGARRSVGGEVRVEVGVAPHD